MYKQLNLYVKKNMIILKCGKINIRIVEIRIRNILKAFLTPEKVSMFTIYGERLNCSFYIVSISRNATDVGINKQNLMHQC